ncbi:hypothetical protein ACFQ7I_39960 [Streptomyces massasporeus]
MVGTVYESTAMANRQAERERERVEGRERGRGCWYLDAARHTDAASQRLGTADQATRRGQTAASMSSPQGAGAVPGVWARPTGATSSHAARPNGA